MKKAIREYLSRMEQQPKLVSPEKLARDSAKAAAKAAKARTAAAQSAASELLAKCRNGTISNEDIRRFIGDADPPVAQIKSPKSP